MGLAEVIVSISQPFGEKGLVGLPKTRLQKQV